METLESDGEAYTVLKEGSARGKLVVDAIGKAPACPARVAIRKIDAAPAPLDPDDQ
jgi:hypothetical protein